MVGVLVVLGYPLCCVIFDKKLILSFELILVNSSVTYWGNSIQWRHLVHTFDPPECSKITILLPGLWRTNVLLVILRQYLIGNFFLPGKL